jgi:integrase
MAAPKFPFTDTRLDVLQPGPARYTVQDEKNPGLFLRVTPTGAKAFYLVVWHAGKTRWAKLGSFPGMTVRQAVTEYRARRGTIGANGELAQAAAIRRTTLDAAWDEYLRLNPDGQCATTLRNRRLFYGKHLRQPLGGQFLHEIRPREIEQVKGHLRDAGYAGRTINEALIIIRVVYSWAVRMELLPEGYRCPANAVKRAKCAEPRERRLHSDEYRAFLDAVRNYGVLKHPDLSPGYRRTVAEALQVMLFTGARSANVKAMAWSEINMDLRLWAIPASKTKTGKAYHLPLTSQVVEILRARHAGPAGLGDYVFPGESPAPHLGEIKNSFRAICDMAGLDGLTVHDLRRTQGSVQADLGVNQALIGKALCHADIRSTAVYTQSSGVEQLRANFERANTAMAGAAAPESLALTMGDWEEIIDALGDSPLAVKVRTITDIGRVA